MSPARTLLITPRDPLIFRDGRPFDSALTSYISVYRWPPPSVTAGALRTALGRQDNCLHDPESRRTLNQVDIRGPLPYTDHELYVPAPLDCWVSKSKDDLIGYALRPEYLGDDEGVDLYKDLSPLLPHPGHDEACVQGKPNHDLVWWPLKLMTEWLERNTPEPWKNRFGDCLEAFPLEERTHVAIDPKTGAAKTGQLFTTRAIDLRRAGHKSPIQLALHIEKYSQTALDGLENTDIPLGAERRTATLSSCNEQNLWSCPETIKTALSEKPRYVRMVLATPAIFKPGWRPDWIDPGTLTGKVPGTDVEVGLRAAAIGRWQPVSGWAYGKSDARQKATRKMVPAGSVYFFEIKCGDVTKLADQWLRPVCGRSVLDPESKLGADGFGLALWGPGPEPKPKLIHNSGAS
ncbi:MAG: type III-B CRISPR module-associated protein Cmr3 [Xanthomonadaceae bacterium]|jgi:CRISPR-associated protein Cmr3|nr:type III-B CRISPR module-associated protein Cmr3 [Xanthomonadaceae bacterium]